MRLSVYFCCLVLLACSRGDRKTTHAVYPIGDAEDWLNDDENFGKRRGKGSKQKDSVEVVFTLKADINSDGNIDTVNAIAYRKRKQTIIRINGFPSLYLGDLIEDLQITDAGDLNGDGRHELLVLQQGSESCWDNLRLFTLNNAWEEKYNGMTYQCIERPMYQFTKLNDKTIAIKTYGESRDSIDAASGDTLEQVLPNEQRVHLINW